MLTFNISIFLLGRHVSCIGYQVNTDSNKRGVYIAGKSGFDEQANTMRQPTTQTMIQAKLDFMNTETNTVRPPTNKSQDE